MIQNVKYSLKEKNVFCPVDKAGCSFSIIWKKFYAEKLHGELNELTYKIYSVPLDVLLKNIFELLCTIRNP